MLSFAEIRISADRRDILDMHSIAGSSNSLLFHNANASFINPFSRNRTFRAFIWISNCIYIFRHLETTIFSIFNISANLKIKNKKMSVQVEISEILNIPYVTRSNDRKHHLDIYKPASSSSSSNHPVLVFVHGGGWQRGDKRLYQNVGKSFAANGFVTVLPSYRLTVPDFRAIVWISSVMSGFWTVLAKGIGWFIYGKSQGEENFLVSSLKWFSGLFAGFLGFSLWRYRHERRNIAGTRHPRHANDIADALVWVQKNIQQFGGDSSKISLIGHSAGGHLVSLIALDRTYLDERGFDREKDIKCVISISGVYSLERFKTRRMERRYLYTVFGRNPEKWEKAFPIFHANANKGKVPPFLLINAGIDGGLELHTDDFAQALQKSGIQNERLMFKCKNHFSIVMAIGSTSVIWNLIDYLFPRWIASLWRSVDQITDTLHIPELSEKEFIVSNLKLKYKRDEITSACLAFLSKQH
jgi:acetyl esterase/lipase